MGCAVRAMRCGQRRDLFHCVDLEASGIACDDEAFAAAAVERAGVAVVPLTAFAESDPPRHLVRLCFAKRDETIDAGVAAMARARELSRDPCRRSPGNPPAIRGRLFVGELVSCSPTTACPSAGAAR